MAKIFENSVLVNRLSKDDPECNYVNKMMEMPPEFLRDLFRNTKYETLHGVVPSYLLPQGYSYGKIDEMPKYYTNYDMIENKVVLNINSQSSSKFNSTARMENDEHDNETNHADEKMIETVRGDLTLSEDEDDNDSISDVSPDKGHCVNNITDNFKLLLDTLDACSKKIPILKSRDILTKYYKPKRSNSDRGTDSLKKPLSRNPTSDSVSNKESVDTNSRICDEKIQIFMNLISESTYKTQMSSKFQTIYDLAISRNSNKKRKYSPEKIPEGSIKPEKLPKLVPVQEKIKPDSCYRFESNGSNGLEISFKVDPRLMKDLFDKVVKFSKNIEVKPKEINVAQAEMKPKYVTQDSLPFITSDSLPRKDDKVIPDEVYTQPSSNTINSDSTQNPVRKPEAAAKQFFASHSNLSNYNSNAKIAVVAGKINETQSSLQNKIDRNQSSQSLAGKDSSECDLAVQGLNAIQQIRATFKNDFIIRMRNLDNDKWLKEAHSLKEKANSCRTQLDYAPHVMVFIRKNLFYNYSLEVKADFGTSHRTYLENAAMIMNSCFLIAHIYNEHENQIIDKSSSRLWNMKLVKHYTVALCHRLSAILQLASYRNIADDCSRVRDTLVRAGAFDSSVRLSNPASAPVHSPLFTLSSYSHGQGSPATGSSLVPHPPTNDLQRYIDQVDIVRSAFNDWQQAEKIYVSFTNRSSRHQKSWEDFERSIIKKTGGVLIEGIGESVPFVIKYLEGYINYMNEFMKSNL